MKLVLGSGRKRWKIAPPSLKSDTCATQTQEWLLERIIFFFPTEAQELWYGRWHAASTHSFSPLTLVVLIGSERQFLTDCTLYFSLLWVFWKGFCGFTLYRGEGFQSVLISSPPHHLQTLLEVTWSFRQEGSVKGWSQMLFRILHAWATQVRLVGQTYAILEGWHPGVGGKRAGGHLGASAGNQLLQSCASCPFGCEPSV